MFAWLMPRSTRYPVAARVPLRSAGRCGRCLAFLEFVVLAIFLATGISHACPENGGAASGVVQGIGKALYGTGKSGHWKVASARAGWKQSVSTAPAVRHNVNVSGCCNGASGQCPGKSCSASFCTACCSGLAVIDPAAVPQFVAQVDYPPPQAHFHSILPTSQFRPPRTFL